MDLYRKFLTWFKSLPILGKTLLVGILLIVVVLGMWFTSTETSTAARGEYPITWMAGVFLKFGVVIALIYAAALIFKRWQGGVMNSKSRRMKVVETLHLTPKRSLHLVHIGDQIVLIGSTDQSITLISELEEEPPDGVRVEDFRDVLVKAQN